MLVDSVHLQLSGKPMPRLLSLLVLVLVVAFASLAAAEQPSNEKTGSTSANPPLELERSKAHLLAVNGDIGRGIQLGVGYVHAVEEELLHGLESWAYGATVQALLRQGGAEALFGYAVGRYTLLFIGGFSGEVGLGVGTDGENVQYASRLGLFGSMYYVEAGYVFQAPLYPFERPDWLPAHFFSLRIHVPWSRYDREVHKVIRPTEGGDDQALP